MLDFFHSEALLPLLCPLSSYYLSLQFIRMGCSTNFVFKCGTYFCFLIVCLNCYTFSQQEDQNFSFEVLLLKLPRNFRVSSVQRGTQPISNARYRENWGLVSSLPMTTQNCCGRPVLHISAVLLVQCSSDALGGPDTSIFCSGSSSIVGLCGYGSSRKLFSFTYTDILGHILTNTERFSWVPDKPSLGLGLGWLSNFLALYQFSPVAVTNYHKISSLAPTYYLIVL